MGCSEAPPQSRGPGLVAGSSSPRHGCNRMHEGDEGQRGRGSFWPPLPSAVSRKRSPRKYPLLKKPSRPAHLTSTILHARPGKGDPYMPGPLTRAVTRTREPPTSGLVLGAQIPGPDVQGLSSAPARPGGQNSQRHGPPLSWAQAREPSLFLPTGWGWGTQDPSFPETQDGGSGEASSTPWPAPRASPPICGNSETTHRQGIPKLLL